MFVPRSVARKTYAPLTSTVARRPSRTQDAYADESDETPPAQTQGSTKPHEELATLLDLSLTDFSLWRDPELRKLVETRKDGWLTLSALIRHSELLRRAASNETELAMAYRASGSAALELRMSLSPSGGYEIRRTDWGTLEDLGLRHMTEADWDAWTIYVENIPPQHRSGPHAIVGFLEGLFTPAPLAPFSVNGLIFPARQGSSDEYDTACRGFAFVVCASPESARRAGRLWPWDEIGERFERATAEVGLRAVAMKCGFRVTSKNHWTELKAEYLERQEAILAGNSRKAVATTQAARPGPSRTHDDAREPVPTPTRSVGDFPRGCLLFVRNIHPETNKTTLKAIFSKAFDSTATGKELDYVDWTKGVDSCHIRTSSAAGARQMARFFSQTPVRQTGPLDDLGVFDGSEAAIQVEIVDGRREELYWQKVPDKVRLAAVARGCAASDSRKRRKMTMG